ncbi:Metalloendopeptidase OMA1, mitochondrial [Halotydeus destructor]|nr:Metalloendopeptidase OMA1, mitochondrial [Halotydeus destructor]
MKEVPITRRHRFMCFDSDDIRFLTEKQVEKQLHQRVILELSHPAVQRVLKTAKRIIAANNDIKRMTEMEWTVSMLDVPGMINAMVTGKGEIIIYKDMVDACATDDELGIVLAHEMSHAILDHTLEKLSNGLLIRPFHSALLVPDVGPTSIFSGSGVLFPPASGNYSYGATALFKEARGGGGHSGPAVGRPGLH